MFWALGSRRMAAIQRMTLAKWTDDRKIIYQHCFNSLMRWWEQKCWTFSATSSFLPLHCSRLSHHTTAPGNDTHHRELIRSDISVLACLYTGCRRFIVTVIRMTTVNITQSLALCPAPVAMLLPAFPAIMNFNPLEQHAKINSFFLRLLLMMLFCHSYQEVMNTLAYRSKLIFICCLWLLKLAELVFPRSVSEIFGFCMFMQPINNYIPSFRFACLLFPFLA